MKKTVTFGLAISEEIPGPTTPVLIQGGLIAAFSQAAQWGYDAVEIHIRNPREFDGPALADAAGAAGIQIAAIGTGFEYGLNGLCLTSPDAEIRARTVARFEEHIDLAKVFGATVFVGLCRGTAPDLSQVGEYLDRFKAELIPIAAYALERGVVLSIEPIASYMTNLLTTTKETIEFISSPGLESIRLLMDTHHMFLEDGDLDATFEMCRGRIGHLHISDSDRKFGVSGEIDYRAVGESLIRIGYDRSVSLEVLPEPDGRTAALLALEWMRGVWGE